MHGLCDLKKGRLYTIGKKSFDEWEIFSAELVNITEDGYYILECDQYDIYYISVTDLLHGTYKLLPTVKKK